MSIINWRNFLNLIANLIDGHLEAIVKLTCSRLVSRKLIFVKNWISLQNLHYILIINHLLSHNYTHEAKNYVLFFFIFMIVVFQMGFIASLPFLLKAIVGPVGGVIADLLRYKCMSTTNVRRLFFAVGKSFFMKVMLNSENL